MINHFMHIKLITAVKSNGLTSLKANFFSFFTG